MGSKVYTVSGDVAINIFLIYIHIYMMGEYFLTAVFFRSMRSISK